MSDVEVVCLPRFLPEYINVDVSGMELDDMLSLSDIKLPEGVEIPALAQGPEADRPIVAIHVIKAAPVEEDLEVEGAAEEGEAAEPAADSSGDEPDED